MEGILTLIVLAAILAGVLWLSSRPSGRPSPPPVHGSRPTAPRGLRERAAGIRFLLEEVRSAAAWANVPEGQRAELLRRYEHELQDIESMLASPLTPPVSRPATPVPQARRREPRKPMDWSWLAEQQANLFLFAGAFLVVVAALIYVGYSGQAVTGALKVSLLAVYTSAFLAAGVVCLNRPLVRVAGLVFLAISSVLVPLNFVLAASVIEADVSDNLMWLAGSLASAGFYTAVGASGLGRQYSFAAGAALASAAAALIPVLDIGLEWAPLPFLGLAVLLAALEAGMRGVFRERVASTWVWQANAIAILALAWAASVAIAADNESDLGSRWFGPPVAGTGLLFYAIRLLRGSRFAVTGGTATIAVFWASFVFGPDLSPEYYAFALIGAGLLVMAACRTPLPGMGARLLHPSTRTDAVQLAHLVTAGGVALAIIETLRATDPDLFYSPDTPWFLLGAFAAAALVYITHLSMPMPALGSGDVLATYGMGLSLGGVCAAVVYGAGWSPEYYAFAAAATAVCLLLLATLGLPAVIGEGPPSMRSDWLYLAHVAAAAAACVAVGAVYAAAQSDAEYAPESRWFLPAAFACLAAFYSLALLSSFRPSAAARVAASLGLVASVYGVTTGVVYALDVSAEYYAFAGLLPAAAIGILGRLQLPRVEGLLPDGWRAGAFGTGWFATLSGLAVALAAAVVASFPESSFHPDTRAYLPVAFLAAAFFFALDASRGRRWWPSAALLATAGGGCVTLAYGLEGGAEYYGVGLACIGLAYGFGGRVWSPAWLDERARDQAAVAAVTLGWLPFEAVYEDHLRFGAGAHFAAAVLYAGAAVADRSERTFNQLLGVAESVPVRLAAGWLYAAGLMIVLGYVDVLRSLSGGEAEEGGSLALPLAALGVGFLAGAALFRRSCSDLRVHVYVVGLLTAIAAVSMAPDSLTLAAVLSVFVLSFAAVAAWEDAPSLGSPAAVFGFAAVIAWRVELGWPLYAVPIAYSAVAAAVYGAGFGLLRRRRKWSDALRATGAAFAVASPGIGFGILAAETDGGDFDGSAFETSALYEWSTLATGVLGLIALAEASVARRGWIVVAGSAVLLVAVLMGIGRFQPDNVQAYTAVIGTYLVLLALIALSRYRLVPGLAETAVYIESLGAATIMFPSFIQSLDGGWRYEVILLVEAAGFFAAGVILQRRGLLSTSLLAIVLIGGRLLFDAINALPNWIVALILGMALLCVGFVILIGRDRWTSWEKRVLSWWGQPPEGSAEKKRSTRLRPRAPGA